MKFQFKLFYFLKIVLHLNANCQNTDKIKNAYCFFFYYLHKAMALLP